MVEVSNLKFHHCYI